MMRNWSRSFRRASFRGVPFHVDADGPESGRRVVVHEISGGERAVTEDMGARTRRFLVEAYVASDAADMQGRALEVACGAPGPGLLTLPLDPAVFVHCEGCVRDRRRDQAGFLGYRLDFVEAGSAVAGVGSALGMLREVFGNGLASAASSLSGHFR